MVTEMSDDELWQRALDSVGLDASERTDVVWGAADTPFLRWLELGWLEVPNELRGIAAHLCLRSGTLSADELCEIVSDVSTYSLHSNFALIGNQPALDSRVAGHLYITVASEGLWDNDDVGLDDDGRIQTGKTVWCERLAQVGLWGRAVLTLLQVHDILGVGAGRTISDPNDVIWAIDRIGAIEQTSHELLVKLAASWDASLVELIAAACSVVGIPEAGEVGPSGP